MMKEIWKEENKKIMKVEVVVSGVRRVVRSEEKEEKWENEEEKKEVKKSEKMVLNVGKYFGGK